MARRRSRRLKQEAAVTEIVKAPNYIKRNIPPYEILDDDALTILENNADTILEEKGVELLGCHHAVDTYKKAGAIVNGEHVRFPRGMLREIIQKSAPQEFTQHARNPDKNVIIGGKHTVLGPAGGPPFVYSLKEGRRYANYEDLKNFIKLSYMLDSLHHSGSHIVEAMDLPNNSRHLDLVYSLFKYSDKPNMGAFSSPVMARDTMSMGKIVFGEDFFTNNCVLLGNVNANSPLRWDDVMLESARTYIENNQAAIFTPFIIAGAMGPVATAAVASQSLAESMVGMAYAQLLKPGAPVVFGSFATSMSMQSGAPTFGRPEGSMIISICAALARRLGVPFRSGGGFTTSKIPDAQAGYEAGTSLQHTLLCGVNFVHQTAGWLEGGLATGYEKFVMDADQAGMLNAYAKGVDMSENGQALDAYREVPIGEHFLGSAHTERNYKTAFYNSDLADSNSFEQWKEEGKLDMAKRAEKKYLRLLEEYQEPKLDQAVEEALKDFIKQEKAKLD